MSASGRDEQYPKIGAGEAVGLPRRQLLALVLLTCVPVPLLTFGGLTVPFPDAVQRALAPLPFVDTPGAAIAAGTPASVRAVTILEAPSTAAVPVAAAASQSASPRPRVTSSAAAGPSDGGSSGSAADTSGSAGEGTASEAPADTPPPAPVPAPADEDSVPGTDSSSNPGGGAPGGSPSGGGVDPVDPVDPGREPERPPPSAPPPPPSPPSPPPPGPPPPGPPPPPPPPPAPPPPPIVGVVPDLGEVLEDPLPTIEETVEDVLAGILGKPRR